ncbi:MAG TPA: ABC transporter ATP-binding protein [Candidatus Polarisedimenticolia bacterium]|nr:ABC transporter ATP-binding protein [Candidatus Polarisedimenticolia bacterium]
MRAPVTRPEGASDASLVSVDRVSKTFLTKDHEVAALGPLDIRVREGEFLCILGPSGCGKTTLLSIIAGLETPDSGQVRFDGRPVAGPGPERIVLFQELGLFPWLTVLGNVEFGLRLRGIRRNERREMARRHLKMVRLSTFERSYVHELSGGMKQRAALARALAIDPRLLLMDEPFGALDAQTREVLHLELQDLWERTGKTVIFVTHNVEEAACLGDRVITMTRRPGRIKGTFDIRLQRPRRVEDPEVAAVAARIRHDLRGELDEAEGL